MTKDKSFDFTVFLLINVEIFVLDKTDTQNRSIWISSC